VREVEFRVPKHVDLVGAEHLIELACARRGLNLTMKGSLSSHPGCIHWHYKSQGQNGTLELTLSRRERRIWASVQNGRRSPWIDVELPLIKRAIEGELQRYRPPKRKV
jgi:hypothetical protein